MATTAELLALYDAELRRVIPRNPREGLTYRRDDQLLRVAGDHRGFVETVPNIAVDGAALDALIASQRDFFAHRGEAMEWKTRGHDRPKDIPDRLIAAGFVPEESETVMIAEIAGMARDVPTPRGITFREVEDLNDLERIGELQSQVWGGDFAWLVADLWHRKSVNPERLAILAAEADGEVVSAAWLVLPDNGAIAGLWGGSTLTKWRRRGIYGALVARRADIAVTRGARYLHVDASADSEPILRRLGFQGLTTTTPYIWSPNRASDGAASEPPG